MSKEFVPHTPNKIEIAFRKWISKWPIWEKYFPSSIDDPDNNIANAQKFLKKGTGVNVIMCPHPSETDGVHGVLLMLQIAQEYPILAPIAIHQLNSTMGNFFIKPITWFCGIKLSPVITARTQEKFPGKYSEKQKADMAKIMTQELVINLVEGGAGMEFGQGDRAGTLDVIPPRGILSWFPGIARKLIKKKDFAFLFVYIDYPGIKGPEDIRGLETKVPVTFHIGDLVLLSEATQQSKSVEVSGKQERLDMWMLNKFIEMEKRIHF